MTSFQNQTSSSSPSSLSSVQERELGSSRQKNRRRKSKRCIFTKYFSKTGMILLLGVIILTVLPTKGSCRPVEDHPSLESDEEAIGSRFEFQRKIVSKSSSTSSADSIRDDENVHNLDLIRSNNNNNNNYDEGGSNESNNPLLSNSSMIVHVIVTSSSSSTSSSELETDSEPEGEEGDGGGDDRDTVQYTVEVRDGGSAGGRSDSDSYRSSFSSPSQSSTSTETLKQDLSKYHQPQKQISRGEASADQLELKKLPKSESDDTIPSRPVQDIFSAFYSAFTQPSSSTPPPQPESSVAPSGDDSNSSITTFSLPPPYFRSRRLPQSFQSYQQRRRLFRNRQKQLERKSFSSAPSFGDFSSPEKKEAKPESGGDDVEETARKLESLAKKLDKVEQNKVLEPSPSSVVETSSALPFLISASPPSTLLSPPNIAVSVAVSRSESVAGGGPKGRKRTASSSPHLDQDDERSPTRQRSRVVVGLKRNAKNETGFGQEQEKVLSSLHSASASTPRLPSRRPKPLIKSLPKYEQDYDDGRINNRNSGNKNNSPRNFSNGHDDADDDDDVGTGRGIDNGNNAGKVSDNNFRNLQDHHQNIIAFSEDGDRIPNSSSSLSIPSAESSSFVEITASRPSSVHRRKITRTVSGEIGDPSTYPFNLHRNNFQLHNRKPNFQLPTTTSTTPPPQPKVINWQQPEKVWGQPAQVWGLPAEVWGEPERVWGEPAKIWGETEKVWQSPPPPPPQQQKKLTEIDIDEMMQSDQPPEDRSPPGEEASTKETEDGGPSPQGTFVILGDDENEGDSIDGDLGRPLMLHHFTIPPKPKETVSISTSVSSSVSSHNKNEGGDVVIPPVPFSRKAPPQPRPSSSIINAQFTRVNSRNTNSSSFSVNINNSNNRGNSSNDNDSDEGGGDPSQKKSGKKFGYVIEGANVRKYRVEERTPDGYIVGEYGVLNNQNAFLRGVRYTADGTINPRLIHEALMKFLSLRRR